MPFLDRELTDRELLSVAVAGGVMLGSVVLVAILAGTFPLWNG